MKTTLMKFFNRVKLKWVDKKKKEFTVKNERQRRRTSPINHYENSQLLL